MNLRELSDDELLAELRQRSTSRREPVVEELFARHYERVARWCVRFTGDRDAAADLAQEVFLKAYRYLHSFKGTARFSTWLYTIARNEAFNRFERAGPVPEDDEMLNELASGDAGPEELAQRQDLHQRLETWMAENLDRMERVVFTLHYGDEVPLETITRMLRLENPSGSKAYIVSARRKLAKAVRRLRAGGKHL
jgi:RNA polymerase sigma-70 factor, ECF subfamily